MQPELTFLLLRTINLKPTGLKLRLKIELVHRNLQLGDTIEEFPMVHAPSELYLGMPTPSKVRYPVLLGVIKRPHPDKKQAVTDTQQTLIELGNHPPNLSEESYPTSLGRRVISSLHRSDNRLEAKDSESALFEPAIEPPRRLQVFVDTEHSARPETPTSLILYIMQNLVCFGKSLGSQRSGVKMSPGLASGNQSKSKDYELIELEISKTRSIGEILAQLHTSLINYREYLPPDHPDELRVFESLVCRTQKVLYLLASSVLDVLIEPFCEVLSRFSVQYSCDLRQGSLPKDVGAIDDARSLMIRLIRVAKTPLHAVSELDLKKMPAHGGFLPDLLMKPILNCLILPKFACTFFRLVEKTVSSVSSRE